MWIAPKHSRYICELVLQGKEHVFESTEMWTFVSERLMAVHNLVMGAEELKSYWMDHLQFSVGRLLKIIEPSELPSIEEGDSDETIKLKTDQRFKVFKTLYSKMFSPIKFSIYNNEGEKQMILSQSDTVEPFTAIGNLFENWTFYLPKGKDIVQETERWKTEILVRVYGGNLLSLQGEITANTVVLGFGSLRDHLIHFPICYQAMVYNPTVIMDCIKADKKLTREFLDIYSLFGNNVLQPGFSVARMTPFPPSPYHQYK